MIKKILLLIILLPFVIFSQDNKSTTSSQNYSFRKQAIHPIDFTKYKEIIDLQDAAVPPLFKDCKDSIDNSICTRRNIQDFIVQNFDKKLVAAFLNKTSTHKVHTNVFAYIIINKQGKISNIDAVSEYPSITNEAKRVLNTMPVFIPAKNKKREKIAVRYSFVMHVHYPGKTSKTIDFSEKMATYKDCHFDDQLRNFKCLSNALRRTIQKSFRPSKVINKRTLPGKYNIAVRFIINKKGDISIINSKKITKKMSKRMSIAIVKEAIKSIKIINHLKPASNLDKPKNSSYSLPISFIVVD